MDGHLWPLAPRPLGTAGNCRFLAIFDDFCRFFVIFRQISSPKIRQKLYKNRQNSAKNRQKYLRRFPVEGASGHKCPSLTAIRYGKYIHDKLSHMRQGYTAISLSYMTNSLIYGKYTRQLVSFYRFLRFLPIFGPHF